MQYIMLLLMLVAVCLLVLLISKLTSKKSLKSCLWIVLTIVVVAVIVAWYFTPYKYHIPDDYSNVKIMVYTKEKSFQELDDGIYEQRIIEEVSKLSLRRRFFNGYEFMKFDAYEYLYIVIYFDFDDGGEERINLNLTMNEEGFVYGSGLGEGGFGYDGGYNKILNPHALIDYVVENLL